MWRFPLLVLCLLALSPLNPALAQPPGGHPGRPKVDFDENQTPLQKALEGKIKERRRNARETSSSCTDAVLAEIEAKEPQLAALLAIDNPTNQQKADIRDLRKDLRRLGKECKSPGKSARTVSTKELTKGGKRTGKRLVTETIVDYETPADRDPNQPAGSWPAMILNNLTGSEFGNRFASDDARVLGASFLQATPVNNDQDCLDRVTDQVTHACFDGAALLQTMTRTADGCRHVTGVAFVADPADGVADDCFDDAGTLQTSLRELIDEDWADGVDQDGDGAEGEDGPDHPSGVDPCTHIGGKPASGVGASMRVWDQALERGLAGAPLANADATAGCDLTAVAIKAANARAMAEHGRKAFKADANGNCDESAEGEVACGQERRRVKVKESLTARCRHRAGKPQPEFVDGQCVAENAPPQAGLRRLPGAGDWASPGFETGPSGWGEPAALGDPQSGGPAADPSCTANGDGTYTCTKKAMMGFTVVPPVWEWGFEVGEEVCIDLGFTEFCFEIFYARIGYEFDFAAGLRLPVDLAVQNVPGTVLAGTSLSLETELQPSDNFTVGDYKQFCQQHDLASSSMIRDCNAFAEAEFLSSLDFTRSEDEKDGAELIARITAFAGLQVRVVEIPIINWALDLDVDLPKMCTLYQIKRLITDGTVLPGDLVGLGLDLAKRKKLYDVLRDHLGVCGSFETPFGFEPDPILRSFPFAEQTISIPADCSPEPNDVVTTDKDGKDKKKKICTGLILGIHGASLGVGLEFITRVGSTLIEADLGASGDGCAGGSGCPSHPSTDIDYRIVNQESSAKKTIGPISFDDYNGSTDEGRVSIDNLLYHLNAFGITVNANLDFGGILSPLPDLLSVVLMSLTLDLGDNSPIRLPQHSGTEPVTVPLFVENYALTIDARPADDDPARVDANTLAIKPGEFGQFRVYPENLGSVTDTVDQFVRKLSNQPNQSSPFRYFINFNTDFDCRDGAGAKLRGYPYDAIADDCYTATGDLRPDRSEAIDEDNFGPGSGPVATRDEDGDQLADEDPPDVWATNPDAPAFFNGAVGNIPAHTSSTAFATLSVSPFRHPLTAPGLYPVEINADSVGARTKGLAPVTPRGHARLDAFDTVFIRVESFFDPRVALEPVSASIVPGASPTYRVEGANYGNSDDTIVIESSVLDSNQAGCTLTTLGTLAACPHRAEITKIPASWLTPTPLPGQYGPFAPLGSSSVPVTIATPATWAGMEDTTYEIAWRAHSTAEPSVVSEWIHLQHVVRATQQSMTRYIGLEIRSFIEDIERAIAAGIPTGGLEPVLLHPVETTNGRALDAILAGDGGDAAKKHETMIQIMGGFLKQLESRARSLPPALAADWTARANAIVADLGVAVVAR
jgi:hypothetical protein